MKFRLNRLARALFELGALPNQIVNNTLEDAGPVMANFNYLDTGLPLGLSDFRLTLTTATPVTTADVTAAATVFVSPYKGGGIQLWNATTGWNARRSAEMAIAVPAAANTLYDVFCYDNANVPTPELQSWTSDTLRTVALAKQDGVLVKAGDATRRYVGTFRTTGVAGQVEDSLAKRYVWNYYNRVRRAMVRTEPTGSWAYTINVARQANANALNQLDYVIGVSEDFVDAELTVSSQNTNVPVQATAFIGLDGVVTPLTPQIYGANNYSIAVNIPNQQMARVHFASPVGRHTLVWAEQSAATGTTTWQSAGWSGLVGSIWG